MQNSCKFDFLGGGIVIVGDKLFKSPSAVAEQNSLQGFKADKPIPVISSVPSLNPTLLRLIYIDISVI